MNFILKDNATLTEMADTLVSHVTHLFSSNSTLGRKGMDTWDNFTSDFENKTWLDIARDTLQTLNMSFHEGKEYLG